MDYEERIITADITAEDFDSEPGLRPKVLSEYVGQTKIKENLRIYIAFYRKI